MSHLDTIQLHAGQHPDRETHSRAVPIYMTTSYCYDDAAMAAGVFDGSMPGYTYSRIENPTVHTLEERITAIEEGAAIVTVCDAAGAMLPGEIAAFVSDEQMTDFATVFAVAISAAPLTAHSIRLVAPSPSPAIC